MKRDMTFDKCSVDSSKLWNVLRDYNYYFQIFNHYYK